MTNQMGDGTAAAIAERWMALFTDRRIPFVTAVGLFEAEAAVLRVGTNSRKAEEYFYAQASFALKALLKEGTAALRCPECKHSFENKAGVIAPAEEDEAKDARKNA